jgi:hypothetical protein
MLVLIEKLDEKAIKVHQFNVFYSVLILLYIVYSVIAKDIEITNKIFTNIISANFLLFSIGSSIKRTVISNAFQEKLILFYFVVLCFPINIIQNNDVGVIVVRKFVFFIIFNLECYVGVVLKYPTNFKQLFLVSFFVLIVDPWFLIGSIVIVLSHFFEIERSRGYFKTEEEDDEEIEEEEEAEAEEEEEALAQQYIKNTRISKIKTKKNKKTFGELKFNLIL